MWDVDKKLEYFLFGTIGLNLGSIDYRCEININGR